MKKSKVQKDIKSRSEISLTPLAIPMLAGPGTISLLITFNQEYSGASNLVIILSAINSVFAVGLQPYMEQSAISITNCFVSMICGIITSIELYLSIQSNMENELSASKDFYILGVDIYKTLNLNRENRGGKKWKN